MTFKRTLLLLPLLGLAGCGISAREASREANEACRGQVASITPIAKAYGKTKGIVAVCKDGQSFPIE